MSEHRDHDNIPAEVREVKAIADATLRQKDIERDELVQTFRDIEARARSARERLESEGDDSPHHWRWPWMR